MAKQQKTTLTPEERILELERENSKLKAWKQKKKAAESSSISEAEALRDLDSEAKVLQKTYFEAHEDWMKRNSKAKTRFEVSRLVRLRIDEDRTEDENKTIEEIKAEVEAEFNKK